MVYEQELEEPAVGIVLLNWYSYETTASCLESLSGISYPNHSILVVDNGSEDGSGERIDQDFQDVEVVFTNENLGFAGGCNVGIETFVERGFDYILLLNNDTIVDQDFLTHLVETAERRENVGAVGSVIYRMSSDEIWSAGGEFSSTLARIDPNTSVSQETEYETEFISGAAMLLPREAIQSLGMLDESYFYGFEDQEFSYRARKNGWSLYINPQSIVYHEVGKSSGEGNSFRFYHATRNRLIFAEDYLSKPEYLFFLTFFFLSRLVRIFQWSILKPDRIGRSRGIILGVWDHLTRRDLRRPTEFDLMSDR